MAQPSSAAALAYLVYQKFGDDIDALNRLLRSRIGERGKRFEDDHPDTFMYITRSKNANVVAYTARLVDEDKHCSVPSGVGRRCTLDAGDPVHAYFISLEPKDADKLRAKGCTSLIEELSFLERTMAYGCSGKRLDPHSAAKKVNAVGGGFEAWLGRLEPFSMSYVALSKYAALLVCLKPLRGGDEGGKTGGVGGDEGDTKVVLIAVVDGTLSVLRKIYVQSREPKHFFELPTVEYVEFFGVALETGEETVERKKG
ncbi:putative protein of unknown function (DUF4833) [Trypanosoma vivax]|uniref:DUF4833 domain-containing protein n=1 Tax=Trypanosoma vivax (strain Y486) TaxID=1055687 RepID=G0U5E0_TRYVY|nr:hypothetical protein TRVL_06473 [Trypanosoma vivax]KAH8618428.1 putative protein of unknown function (DUF4833) [Trypanosoma vivax]CCC51088.1 conserved hypothetical protein [Trypanosoma vivax Y486]